MRAAVLHEFGGPEKFEIADVPIPVTKPGTVLIRNRALGIHYADIRQREGVFPFSLIPKPAVIGFEVAGTVEEVGDGVEGIRPGMRVLGSLLPEPDEFGKRSLGGYAEYAVADAEQVAEIPDYVSFEQALAYVSNLPSAYLIYNKFQPIAPDATVMIHTAAGGLGSCLTQVAKQAGNTVIALIRREEKAQICLGNGADHVVISSRDGWVDDVRALTGERGIDVSFNSVAGDTVEKDIELLGYRGGIFFTALMQGWPQSLSEDATNKLTMANLNLQFVRTAEMARSGALAEKARAYRDEFLRTAKLQSPSAIYRLEDVAQAHLDFESGKTLGKVVLTFD